VASIDKRPPASGHGERTDFKVFFVNPTRSAVSGQVTVTIGTDSGGGSQQPTYVVSVDGTQIYVGANPTFTWNTHNVANGRHIVTALVRGEAGATGQSSMIVTVSNAKKRRIGSPQPRAPQSG
jgi:hypothetical protein